MSAKNDFILAKELLYQPSGFNCSEPVLEAESAEYGACDFKLNDFNIKYRIAKITPTKTGQFVTLWKRNQQGIIEPFEMNDKVDFFIISTRKDNRFGQFIFPKALLYEKGVISDERKEGKRAIRVYPPWDEANSKQAQKTQQWQLKYFLEIPEGGLSNLTLAKQLLGNKLG
ncbi:MepB family protein [Arcicella sp. DC2W]|uniref:MepB family protein n=1 Tax=Arcicella gelida TaxID=2984195 RepID=A0ABU5S0A9_9BACT|nr:MepB family protein [Arcicella sp. DC2W]MEA5401908.1 MepB family protein [Arcicella sp. DC2W]